MSELGLGKSPSQLRGQGWSTQEFCLERFDKCVACSAPVLTDYARLGTIDNVCSDPGYLEKLSGVGL